MKRWIWQQQDYPHFKYDSNKLESLLEKVAQEQGYLIAMSKVMSDENVVQTQYEALFHEAIATSAIEGEILNRDSVKSSIQKKLGLIEDDRSNTEVDSLIEILLDANTNYYDDLTMERLFGWHYGLFPKGYSNFYKINVATLRGEETMQVVGGRPGNETVYYEAPTRDILEDEMARFLQWFNETPESLLKAAIAHLWFVVIHPFEDGNGRIARAVTDLVLSKIENAKISRLYSMSNAINRNKKNYYKALERTTGYLEKDDAMDITYWCEWFLTTLLEALVDAKKSLYYVIEKTKFWDKHSNDNLNARQVKILNKILDMGVDNFKGDLSKKNYMKIADTTPATASRDIAELIRLGCIEQVEGTDGRNVRYRVVLLDII